MGKRLNINNFTNEQLDAIEVIKSRKRVQINAPMNFGKTVTVLEAFKQLKHNGEVKKLLYIAPATVVKNVVNEELNNWSNLDCLTGGFLQTKDYKKANHNDIEAISINSLPKFVNDCKRDFEMLVVDEVSLFKHFNTQRFKAMRKLLKEQPKLKYIVTLTGTPPPYMSFFTVYYILDRELFGEYITDFRNRFFSVNYNGYGYTLLPYADEALEIMVEPYTVSYKAVKLNVKLKNKFPKLKFTKKLKKKYKEFEKEFILDLKNEKIDIKDSDLIKIESGGILSQKLLQFCNGRIINTETSEVYKVHDIKLNYLKRYMKKHPNENVLVMYSNIADRDAILDTFPYAETKSDNFYKRWNDGEIKMLVLHPASTGYGLNLQFGGYTMIWYGLTWSYEFYAQASMRLYRRGQTHNVKIIHLALGGIERKLMRKLASSDEINEQLLTIGRRL